MSKFILGIIFGFLLIAGGVYLYVESGLAPVATSSGAMPFERWLAKSALRAKIRREAPKDVPLQPTEANLLAGARIYFQNCAMCHGMSGQTIPDIAKGMFPRPPQLLTTDEMVTDDPPGETFWKTKNGIRLTGMPAFQSSLSDGQLWQVAIMLSKADKLSPAVQKEVSASPGNAR